MYIFLYYNLRRNKIKNIKHSEQLSYDNFYEYLTFSRISDIDNLISSALKDYVESVELGVIHCHFNEKINIYNFCYKEVLCKDDIIAQLKAQIIDCTVPSIIVVIDIDNIARKMLLDKYDNIDIIDYKELYDMLYSYNGLPKNFECSKSKSSIKQLFLQAFTKTHFKSYLFASIIVTLSAFFIPMRIYYLIWATVLLICAIVSYFDLPNKKVSHKKRYFDVILKK